MGSLLPREPKNYREAGLTETQVEELVLKSLLARGDIEGRQIAEQIKLPFGMLEALLRRLKHEQLVVYRDAAQVNDYQYQLTDIGRERARRYTQDCSYYGAAPVTLRAYIESVKAQSLTLQRPSETRTAARVRRPADQPPHAETIGSGDQLRSRHVPVRLSGQRQDEHRRTRDQVFWGLHLDSAIDWHRR